MRSGTRRRPRRGWPPPRPGAGEPAGIDTPPTSGSSTASRGTIWTGDSSRSVSSIARRSAGRPAAFSCWSGCSMKSFIMLDSRCVVVMMPPMNRFEASARGSPGRAPPRNPRHGAVRTREVSRRRGRRCARGSGRAGTSRGRGCCRAPRPGSRAPPSASRNPRSDPRPSARSRWSSGRPNSVRMTRAGRRVANSVTNSHSPRSMNASISWSAILADHRLALAQSAGLEHLEGDLALPCVLGVVGDGQPQIACGSR